MREPGDMEKIKEASEKRGHIRLHYPAGKQPLITIRGRNYKVTDLSDMGVRIDCPNSTDLIGPNLEVVLHFPFGERIETISKLEWVSQNKAGLSFDTPIDLSVLLEEQERIILDGQ